mmetsp:Transcript_109883/g.305668  ORF Transcript_109883/g.305668 Transcript_109883/m.305668 type:complete len:273 (+) Transcript_109883:283-1101(+)
MVDDRPDLRHAARHLRLGYEAVPIVVQLREHQLGDLLVGENALLSGVDFGHQYREVRLLGAQRPIAVDVALGENHVVPHGDVGIVGVHPPAPRCGALAHPVEELLPAEPPVAVHVVVLHNFRGHILSEVVCHLWLHPGADGLLCSPSHAPPCEFRDHGHHPLMGGRGGHEVCVCGLTDGEEAVPIQVRIGEELLPERLDILYAHVHAAERLAKLDGVEEAVAVLVARLDVRYERRRVRPRAHPKRRQKHRPPSPGGPRALGEAVPRGPRGRQ